MASEGEIRFPSLAAIAKGRRIRKFKAGESLCCLIFNVLTAMRAESRRCLY